MQIKTRELTGDALEWVVTGIELNMPTDTPAHIQGWFLSEHRAARLFAKYLSRKSLLLKIIERERINLCDIGESEWEASKFSPDLTELERVRGNTLAEAVLRCYALLNVGEVVDVPEVLL